MLKLGDKIQVKIIGIDGNDRIKLSRRVILEEEARARGEEIPDRRAGRPEGGEGGDRGGRPPAGAGAAATAAAGTTVAPVATAARVAAATGSQLSAVSSRLSAPPPPLALRSGRAGEADR